MGMERVIVTANTSWYLYNFRKETIRALMAEGFSVYCLAARDEYTKLLEKELGAIFVEIEINSRGTVVSQEVKLVLRYILEYKNLRPKFVLNYTIKPNLYSGFAAIWNGVPFSNNVTGLGSLFINRSLLTVFVEYISRLIFRRAKIVYFQNPDDYMYFLQKKICLKKSARIMPGSGVDTVTFNNSANKNIKPFNRFMFVGRLIREKGVCELFQAIENLYRSGVQFEFTLAGKISDKGSVDEIGQSDLDRITKLPCVNYLGHVNSVESYFLTQDFIVLPSYREGLSRVLLEAGASGLPAITTDVTGCNTVIEHNYNGWLCEAASVGSLQSAIEFAISIETDEYQRLSKNARSRIVKRFDVKIVTEQTVNDVKGYI